jgi:methylase of polypeptide subunit release factors
LDIEQYGRLKVYYTHELDGGGRTFGQQFIPFVRDKIGPVRTAFEWCAGPGFIGFSMLSEGLCEHLALADVNPAAVEAATKTVERNALASRVEVYRSDCFDSVPAQEKWDLVVANPPHSGTNEVVPHIDRPGILYMDPDWSIHRRFYAQVGSHLSPGGSVVVQENALFSSTQDFEDMITASGLEWVESVEGERGYYFIWTRSRERR